VLLSALAIPAAVAALAAGFHSSSAPLSPAVRAELRDGRVWRAGCPVGLTDLRVLAVTHWGFDGRRHTGRLIVGAQAVAPLSRVFGRLYALHFPIRHLTLRAMYGPGAADIDDASGSFSCRQAVPSPCTGGNGTGTWSMHAYGLAVDVNPRENPYVGCGMSRDPAARRYRDRSRHRKGMVTRNVIQAFAAEGWGWGGAWSGDTKDYMHFSSSGR
jgi:D-alanyl-D-alanine carboxypeptidase